MIIEKKYKILCWSIAIMLLIIIFSQNSIANIENQFNKSLNTNPDPVNVAYFPTLVTEVWVDDDYYNGGYNDGHIWGYDAFDNIQDGIDNADDGGIIYVKDGAYSVFSILDRSDLVIEGYNEEVPLIQGFQLIWDLSAAQLIRVITFVNNSLNVVQKGMEFQGINLTGRSVGIFYQKSSGRIIDCIVSPNQKGNMNNLAIRAHINSVVTISNCTIENYGRIGIYCRQGTTLTIEDNTIIGQIYTNNDGDYVSYGIEIESLPTASQAQIRNNDIYNHDYIGNPSWSSAAIIIDAWRYYEESVENCTAVIEYNNVHDNMIGIQIVPNDNIHLNYNIISDNSDFGAVSDPYLSGSSYIHHDLDSRYNWWGDSSGPYEEINNPDGLGNEVTDFIIYDPWARTIEPSPYFIRPQEGFLYYNIADLIELKIPFFMTLIIGKTTIEINTPRCLYGIDYVEFYVDDELKSTVDNAPYGWIWNEKTLFNSYTIEVRAFDNRGNSNSVQMKSWKIQMRT
jgi:hypothetical protein